MPSRMPRPVVNSLAAYADPGYDPRTELIFQDNVERQAIRYGLLVYHTHDSRGSRKGWPDLVVAGPGGVIFRELKIPPRKPTMEQQRWLDLLTQLGDDATVWTPEHWRTGEIAQTFARLCQPSNVTSEQQARAAHTDMQRRLDLALAAADRLTVERDNARAHLAAAREDNARLRALPEVGGGFRG